MHHLAVLVGDFDRHGAELVHHVLIDPYRNFGTQHTKTCIGVDHGGVGRRHLVRILVGQIGQLDERVDARQAGQHFTRRLCIVNGGAAHHHHHVGLHAGVNGIAVGGQHHARGQQHPLQQGAAYGHRTGFAGAGVVVGGGHQVRLVADDAAGRRNHALQEGAAGTSPLVQRQRDRRHGQRLALQVFVRIFHQPLLVGTEVAGNAHLRHVGLVFHGFTLGAFALACQHGGVCRDTGVGFGSTMG